MMHEGGRRRLSSLPGDVCLFAMRIGRQDRHRPGMLAQKVATAYCTGVGHDSMPKLAFTLCRLKYAWSAFPKQAFHRFNTDMFPLAPFSPPFSSHTTPVSNGPFLLGHL